jgi:hypothetical protein
VRHAPLDLVLCSAMSTRLAPLSYVPPSELDHLETPVPRIKTEEDVKAWRTTSGYDSLRAFIAGLAEACVGRELPLPDDPKTKAIPSTPVSLSNCVCN